MTHVIRLKRLILSFWAAWLSLVFFTNLADAARGLGLLEEPWTGFCSGNWKAILTTTARYQLPIWLNAVLFAGVLVWEALAGLLFWRAACTFRGRAANTSAVYAAFTASLSLWAAFLIADEICIAYPLEAVHLRLFVAHLVTLLAIELLPEG